MQLGMIGLGRMGGNMTLRLLRAGHQVVAHTRNADTVREFAEQGATPAFSLEEVVAQLEAPRHVWVMLPAGVPTIETIKTLIPMLSPGDTVIDGGNSNYQSTIAMTPTLTENNLNFVDVGTSGGVWGLEVGYSLMIGGEKLAVERLRPIFESLAPAADLGWGHLGPSGAGHFAKMVHNGIEYGMMQALAEGLSIMRAKTEFSYDLAEVTRIWQHGSVVRSWLLDLIQAALAQDQKLEDIAAYVPDSGEGRWTVFEAINLDVSAPVITASLERRIRSREDGYTEKLLSVMRNAFGGHTVKKVDET